MGDLQSKMEAYADAIATYERVGKFYASQGFALKAIAVYKQIREIIAKHVPQLEERYGHITPKLAELYQQLGLTSDALAALDEVATRLQRQNRDREAIDVFRKIVELDPTNPLPHLRLAEALSRVKDADGAVDRVRPRRRAAREARTARRRASRSSSGCCTTRPDGEHARMAAELYLARNQPERRDAGAGEAADLLPGQPAGPRHAGPARARVQPHRAGGQGRSKSRRRWPASRATRARSTSSASSSRSSRSSRPTTRA